MENRIRIGQVSSIDYKKGLIKVLYQDRDDMVTDELPMLTFEDKYKMPKIGAYVATVHLSNGAEAGYVLGTFWDGSVPPKNGKKKLYRQEYAYNQDDFYLQYDDNGGIKELFIKMLEETSIKWNDTEKELIAKFWNNGLVIQYDDKEKELTVKVGSNGVFKYNDKTQELNIKAKTVNIDGKVNVTGDVKAGSISLQNHTHPGVHGQTGKPS